MHHVCCTLIFVYNYEQNKCRMRVNSNMQYMRDMYANCIHAALQLYIMLYVAACVHYTPMHACHM